MNLRLYESLGFTQRGENDSQLWGDCVFCGKSNKFYLNKKDGLWDCKTCGKVGNTRSFMEQWLESLESSHLDELAENRQIDTDFLRARGVKYDERTARWILATRDKDGVLTNIRFLKPKEKDKPQEKPFGLPGLKVGLYNAERINCCPTVYVCEGEWDCLMVEWQIDNEGADAVAVAVPGANTWKEEWSEWLRGKHVVLGYDNDTAGMAGLDRALANVGRTARSVSVVKWPDGTRDKYDLRDYFIDGGTLDALPVMLVDPKSIASINAAIAPTTSATDPLNSPLSRKERKNRALPPTATTPSTGSRYDSVADLVAEGDLAPKAEPLTQEMRPTFLEVVAEFRKFLNVEQEFEDGLRVAMGVILSNKIPGDALWLHFVGPSGSGKTEILMSAYDARECVVKSTLTPHSLVSGFKTHSNADPSLIPQLNGKTFILKDMTEILSLPRNIKDEVFSILRGAYDGYVEKSYGNGIVRSYDTHFSMLAGVTSAIYRERSASLGERFLMYHMFKGEDHDHEDAIEQAMNNVGVEIEVRQDIRDFVARFIDSPINTEQVPLLNREQTRRIIALAQIVAMLRGQIEKDEYRDRLLYRPQTEVGTRVAKQLKKLLLGLALIETPYEITEKAFQLVIKTALDTCIQFNFDVLNTLIREGPLTTPDIQRYTAIPMTTLRSHLEEMFLLGVLTREAVPQPGRGAPLHCYSVAPKLAQYWKEAQIG